MPHPPKNGGKELETGLFVIPADSTRGPHMIQKGTFTCFWSLRMGHPSHQRNNFWIFRQICALKNSVLENHEEQEHRICVYWIYNHSAPCESSPGKSNITFFKGKNHFNISVLTIKKHRLLSWTWHCTESYTASLMDICFILTEEWGDVSEQRENKASSRKPEHGKKNRGKRSVCRNSAFKVALCI